MSFDQLIICVDASYSMKDNDKLINAKKLLSDVVSSFRCDTKYFYFTDAPLRISSCSFNDLKPCGLTQIEYSLNQLFNSHLPNLAHSGKNTKFIFVTDALDSYVFVYHFYILHNL